MFHSNPLFAIGFDLNQEPDASVQRKDASEEVQNLSVPQTVAKKQEWSAAKECYQRSCHNV
jgi:hypothetical protein